MKIYSLKGILEALPGREEAPMIPPPPGLIYVQVIESPPRPREERYADMYNDDV